MCCLVQGYGKSNKDYKEAFESLWDTLEQQGGSLVHHPGLSHGHADEIAEANGRTNNTNEDNRVQAEDEVATEMKS